ncbi:hypothetical protein HN865_03210 [Candidatus Woesearchaeota archaeon]|nr:hypothetical protein [Candidatus Woesearchaeota archaeon]
MVYKKYIYKKGKKFGPYYFKSIRDKNGSVKSVYLGKKHPNYNLFVLIGVIGLALFLSLVGFVSYNAFVVSDEVISEQDISEIVEEEIIEDISEEEIVEEPLEEEIIEELTDEGIIDVEKESISIEKEIVFEEIINETEINITEDEVIEENVTEILINESEIIEEGRQLNNSIEINLTEDNKTVVNIIEINETIMNITETNQSFVNITGENYTLEIIENIFPVRINEPVKVEKIIISDKFVSGININLPLDASNISILDISGKDEIEIDLNGRKVKENKGNLITGNVVLNFDSLGDSIFKFFRDIFRFTGFVIYEESNDIIVKDSVKEIKVEYYLPGPVSIEKDLGNGIKKIIISSEINYTDVIVYSKLGNVDGGIIVKNSFGKLIDYVSSDLDGDDIVDYIEWISPISEENYIVSIIILNVQSYPVVGGNWTVKFNTTGVADLKITPVNGTTWGIIEDENDLKFLDVRCGNDVFDYVFENQTAIISNYSCDEIGYENSEVITSGKHYLEFDFGGVKVNAQNDALACGTGLASNTDYLLTADVTCASNSHGLVLSSDSNIVLDCDGYTIDGNNKADNYYGISFSNSNNITIKNCVITDFDNGFHNQWGAGQNNTIFNNTISFNDEYGMFLSSASFTNNNISNNTIHSSTVNSGIYLYAPSNVVFGNEIFNNPQRGIVMSSKNGNVIDSNIIYDNTLSGIYVGSSNHNISNNIIYNNSDFGLRLYISSNNIIDSNDIYENQDQNIYLQSGSSNNIIKNNLAHNSDTDQGIYIVNTNCENNSIINNTVYENGNGGIWAGTWGSFVGPGNVISNNTVANHTTNRGIFVEMNNSVISGNIVYNNKNAGIYLYQDSYNFSVYDNIVYDNPKVGIYPNRIYNSNISNNFGYNNTQQGLYLTNSDNNVIEYNNFSNNWISASYGGANQFVNSKFNTFTGNRFFGSGDFLVRTYTNFNNNTFINNVFANSTDELFRCGDGSSCDYNIFIGNTFETNGTNPGLRLVNAEGNMVIDSTHFGPGANPEHSGAGNNTVYINTTWTNTNFGSANTFTRKWYLDVRVNTSDGNLENANVSVFNNSDVLEFSELTDVSGSISRLNFTEYMYDETSYVYYGNYTINTTSPSGSYGNDSREANMSDNVFEYITLSSTNSAPTDPSPSLTSVDGLNLTTSDLNCSATITDPDSNVLNVSVRWYNNSVLSLTVDYNNSYASGTLFNATLDSGNTTIGETWNCSMKLNDGTVDSNWGGGNNLTIIDTLIPNVTWEDPTPSAGDTIAIDNVYLNTTITDDSNTSAFFDWNNSLVSYWSFENYNSSGIYDNSSHSHFGIFSSDLSSSNIVSGKYGNALSFNGVNTSLEVLDTDDIDLGVNYSFSFWIKFNNFNNGVEEEPFSKEIDAGSKRGYYLYKNGADGSLYFITHNATDNQKFDSFTYDIPDEEWGHVAITFNGTYVKMYQNGVFEKDFLTGGPLGAWTTHLILGANSVPNGNYFNGSLDEFSIHSRTLTPEEINASFNSAAYKLYNNFTSLDNGFYNYSAYVMDLYGNLNITETRNVTVDVNYLPVVDNVNITPVSPYTADNLLGYCNASDSNSDNVTYYYEWYKDSVLNNSGSSAGTCADGHTDNEDGTCTVTLRPNSDGDLSDFPTPAAGDHYINVDEASADDDTTFVASTKDAFGTPDVRVTIKENSIISYDTNMGITSSYGTDTYIRTTRPSDSSAWTIADIDALQIGMNVTFTLGTSETELYDLPASSIPTDASINEVVTYMRARTNTRSGINIRVTQVYAEVTYTPAPDYYLPSIEINVNNLSSSLTSKGENWTFNCMAFDGAVNASLWLNTSVIIQNSLPDPVSLSSPTEGEEITDRTPALSWGVPSDDDSDSLTYHVFVNDSAGGIILNQTGTGTNSYTFGSDLTLDDTYFWYVRANDSESFGNWSELWNFTLNSVVTISATTNSISFGSLGPGVTDNTTDDSPAPFVIQNDGNSLVNISVNASQLFDQTLLDNDPYQFKIDNSTETGSFSWLTSLINWLDMPSAAVVAIDSLKYEDDTDTAEVDILVTIPSDELAGSKSSTVYFEAALAE